MTWDDATKTDRMSPEILDSGHLSVSHLQERPALHVSIVENYIFTLLISCNQMGLLTYL